LTGSLSTLAVAIAGSDTLDKRGGVSWRSFEQLTGFLGAPRIASAASYSLYQVHDAPLFALNPLWINVKVLLVSLYL
jgi:hypothetical protein